jgi:hypothetical protein
MHNTYYNRIYTLTIHIYTITRVKIYFRVLIVNLITPNNKSKKHKICNSGMEKQFKTK